MFELDVRVVPPSRKHSTVRERLEGLRTGQTLRIINDHDPRPLRYELDDVYPGAFAWTYVESGPHLWRVDIAKKSEAAARPQVDIVADCHALQVGELRVKAGENRTFDALRAAAALVFHEGSGSINIAGCVHTISAGTVELVYPGEACTISASQDVHAFLVVLKEQGGAS
jgi:uncharacterized protein (DUF2249 family)